MDFARKQLEKYGWTDGKGLGKNENGIAQPLKPKLKRSVTGVGHDAAADFTEHWWTTLYNKATGNVKVTEENGKTKKIKTNSDDFQITNSTWKLNKKTLTSDEDQYSGSFIKKATLTNGGVKLEKLKESESESDEERQDVFKMTDEELFAACEGRTAHKGARHGLRATGKLARIEQQERMLLTQPQYEGYSHAKKIKNKKPANDLQVEDLNLNSDTEVPKTNKKKKKKKHCSNISSFTEVVDGDIGMAERIEPVPGKLKKKRKVTEENVASEIEHGRKSKKSKHTNENNISDADVGCLFKSKKKKKQKQTGDENIVSSTEAESTTNFLKTDSKYEFLDNGVVRKIKKKNKKSA